LVLGTFLLLFFFGSGLLVLLAFKGALVAITKVADFLPFDSFLYTFVRILIPLIESSNDDWQACLDSLADI